jgi:hypothetical protein
MTQLGHEGITSVAWTVRKEEEPEVAMLPLIIRSGHDELTVVRRIRNGHIIKAGGGYRTGILSKQAEDTERRI